MQRTSPQSALATIIGNMSVATRSPLPAWRVRASAAAGAGIALGLSVLFGFVDDTGLGPDPWPILLLMGAVAATSAWPLMVYRNDSVQGLLLLDGLFVVAALTLTPRATYLVFTVGVIVGAFKFGTDLPRRIFNTTQPVAGVVLALLAAEAYATVTGTNASGAMAAVIGAAVMFLYAALSISAAVAFAMRIRWWDLFTDDIWFRVLFWSASVSLGLLVGIAARTDIRTLLFSLIPLAVLHSALAGHRRAYVDRGRISRLIDGTIAAYRATQVEEVQTAVVDATKQLLEASEGGIGLTHPTGALAVRIRTSDTQQRWLWVDEPWNEKRFTKADRRLMEALATVAAGAIANAELVAEIQRQAFHDSLTGLPNHVLFNERLTSALASAREHETKLAVAFLDLDRFKGVNDSLGHSAGDDLLIEIADRLTEDLRAGDTVARRGGDEFTVLWTGLDDVDDARWRCEEVLARLRHPVRVRGQEVFVTGSIGVASHPHDGATAETLVRRADLAMYEAKRAGRNAYRFWVRAHDASLPDLRREGELHAAIDGQELVIHYQPVVELVTGRITSVEALARWNHPVAGLLPPDEFIGLAEELGLVTLIDGWVLQHATEQLAVWHAEGLDDLALAVNVSASRFEDLSFVELVAAQLERTGLAPSKLHLEMTESVAIRDASDTLVKLSELGVTLVMDDFGTGYSMLSRLRSFPLDALKIDRSFMGDDPDDRALVEAIISMARSLELDVVAEGVESREQHERLRGLGCQAAQGYYYSKPMGADEIVTVLRGARDQSRSAGTA